MGEIFECLPRGFEGPVNLLRSLPHPPHKALVRFVNQARCPVNVMWVDFEGVLQDYKVLKHGQFFDCNTFVDHAWVFKDSLTKDAMVVDNKEVFWPRAGRTVVQGQGECATRSLVVIHRPMSTLCTLAARSVRNHMRNIIDPFFVEIPFNLQIMIVKMILEQMDACNEIRPFYPVALPDDEILRRDYDDFQYNTSLVCYTLSNHADKLLQFTSRIPGGGERASLLKGTLSTIIHALRLYHNDSAFKIPMIRIGPVIWKQMIFLRVHFDTLASTVNIPSTMYVCMRHMIERRQLIMLPSHQQTLQRYHWEQIGLLTGSPVHKLPEGSADTFAYDIPEIVPLGLRTEWKWINLRQEQLRDHPNRETILVFLKLTARMLQIMDKLENIFQILCIFHYHLTGKHIPEEN